MHVAPQFDLEYALMTDKELHEHTRSHVANAYAVLIAQERGETIDYPRLHRTLQGACCAALELERRQLSQTRATPPEIANLINS